MNNHENTLTVEISTTNNPSTRVDLALPFYGKVPGENRWIRIAGDRPRITTISIGKEVGVDLFHWGSLEFIGIEDFMPCHEIEWEIAKLTALKTIIQEEP